MPEPHPPYLADAIVRFRAAADAAVERGHRIADEARAAGAAFQRESEALAARLRDGRRESGELDARGAALTERRPPDDDDFSQFRIMRPL